LRVVDIKGKSGRGEWDVGCGKREEGSD
jgi:hypothetical protein